MNWFDGIVHIWCFVEYVQMNHSWSLKTETFKNKLKASVMFFNFEMLSKTIIPLDIIHIPPHIKRPRAVRKKVYHNFSLAFPFVCLIAIDIFMFMNPCASLYSLTPNVDVKMLIHTFHITRCRIPLKYILNSVFFLLCPTCFYTRVLIQLKRLRADRLQ